MEIPNDLILKWIEEATRSGKDQATFIKEKIEQLKQPQEDLITVQILPGHVIAGYGKFPQIVDMPREKALDLAKYSRVKILQNDEDIISEDDEETIQAYLDRSVAIRRSGDSTVKQSRILPLT